MYGGDGPNKTKSPLQWHHFSAIQRLSNNNTQQSAKATVYVALIGRGVHTPLLLLHSISHLVYRNVKIQLM